MLDFVNPWRAAGVLLTLSVPIAIAVGVVRYRLLGITVVLRRSLVYAVLTGVVLAVYVAISAIVGTRLGSGSVAGVVAAGLVILGLAPLRERLQLQIDRLVYGERRDPMRAVTRFADSVAAAAEPGDLLPTALATVTSAVRAPGASVETPEGRVLARHGSLGAGESIPLQFGGSAVGTLHVSARSPTEKYTDGDRRLLSALGLQVAVVVRAIDLAEALEAERDRVVNATKAERDRLRRDLHDGLGPSLAGLGLGLEAVETAIARNDQNTAVDLVVRVRAEARTAVGEIRRILDDLRPAALDDAGLVAALQRHIQTAAAGLPVDLDVALPLPSLSPHVETTAYCIAREALTNVVRHSAATKAHIGVHVAGDRLCVEIFDDGVGIDNLQNDGVGLASMRHRAEALGGTLTISARRPGTAVVACLPLEPAPTAIVRP